MTSTSTDDDRAECDVPRWGRMSGVGAWVLVGTLALRVMMPVYEGPEMEVEMKSGPPQVTSRVVQTTSTGAAAVHSAL